MIRNWALTFKRHHNSLLRYSIEAAVWKTPGVSRKIYLLISKHVKQGQGSLGDFPKNKRFGRHHFYPITPKPRYTDTCRKQSKYSQPSFANSTLHPCILLCTCHIQPALGRSFPKQLRSPTSRPVQTLLSVCPTPTAFACCKDQSNLPSARLHPKQSHSVASCKQPRECPEPLQSVSFPREREGNHTHQVHCSHNQPVKASHGTTQGKQPADRCDYSSGKHLVWPNWSAR